MIAIPNMERPESCWQCYNEGCDHWAEHGYDNSAVCPLIDIVTCGECKYMRKYALRSDEPTGIWCHRWNVPRLVTDDDFCSYGEPRGSEYVAKD